MGLFGMFVRLLFGRGCQDVKERARARQAIGNPAVQREFGVAGPLLFESSIAVSQG